MGWELLRLSCPLTDGWKNQTVYIAVVLGVAIMFSPFDKWKAILENLSFPLFIFLILNLLPHCFYPCFFFWQSAYSTHPIFLFHGFWPSLYLSHKCLNIVLEPALPGSFLSSVNIQCTLLGWALAFLGREVVHITHILKHGTGSLPLLPCIIVNGAGKHFFCLRRRCWCCLLCEHCQSIWKKSGFFFFF